jgi:transposase
MSRKKGKKHKPRGLSRAPAVNLEEIAAIVERTKEMLSAQDHEKLKAAINTLASTLEIVAELIAQLHSKEISVERLRRMLFGSTMEKTEAVLARTDPGDTHASAPGEAPEEPPTPVPKPGHGRLGAAAYAGAERISVPHPILNRGDGCPGCQKGKVYLLAEPSTLIRITGMAPLGARVYACDRLRCNLCGEVYTADSPSGIGEQKYDATASSMVGLLKYGTGTPFNRIEKLQEAMRIPLPAATQWELVEKAAPDLAPAHGELIRQGAQAEVVYNDDTTMKVLRLTREQRAAALAEDADEQRTGVFTSGIVATGQGHQIALFFTAFAEMCGAPISIPAQKLASTIQSGNVITAPGATSTCST